MRRFYPNMSIGYTKQEEAYWQGPVITWAQKEYKIQLRYPSAFPFSPPKAYVMDPKVEQSRHIYPDGHLCLFHKDDKAWEPKTTGATVMSWVSLWLHCYEEWQRTGHWPRQEADEVVISPKY